MIKWSKEGDLWLLRVDEFNQLPDGTELVSIMNKTYIKGKDHIDMDTRSGYLAVGIVDPPNHPCAELCTLFRLSNKF